MRNNIPNGIYYNQDLYHHGILGQKWGVRRFQNEDGSYTAAGKQRYYNKDYGKDQRMRDKYVYGRGGVRRINRNMNRGMSISGARSIEADRIGNARRRARVLGQVGGMVGSVGGAFLGRPVRKLINKYTNYQYSDLIDNVGSQLAISYGMSSVTSQLARYGGQSVGMLLSGYSPSKYR